MTREGLSIFVKGLEKNYGDKKVLRGYFVCFHIPMI